MDVFQPPGSATASLTRRSPHRGPPPPAGTATLSPRLRPRVPPPIREITGIAGKEGVPASAVVTTVGLTYGHRVRKTAACVSSPTGRPGGSTRRSSRLEPRSRHLPPPHPRKTASLLVTAAADGGPKPDYRQRAPLHQSPPRSRVLCCRRIRDTPGHAAGRLDHRRNSGSRRLPHRTLAALVGRRPSPTRPSRPNLDHRQRAHCRKRSPRAMRASMSAAQMVPAPGRVHLLPPHPSPTTRPTTTWTSGNRSSCLSVRPYRLSNCVPVGKAPTERLRLPHSLNRGLTFCGPTGLLRNHTAGRRPPDDTALYRL
jgi:hypothetical protein